MSCTLNTKRRQIQNLSPMFYPLFITHENEFYASIHSVCDSREVLVFFGCIQKLVRLIKKCIDVPVKYAYQFFNSFFVELDHTTVQFSRSGIKLFYTRYQRSCAALESVQTC